MNSMRFKALEGLINRSTKEYEAQSDKISDYFACNAFDMNKMRQFLSPKVFEEVKNAVEKGKKMRIKLPKKMKKKVIEEEEQGGWCVMS